jgi:hypothetical protein
MISVDEFVQSALPWCRYICPRMLVLRLVWIEHIVLRGHSVKTKLYHVLANFVLADE